MYGGGPGRVNATGKRDRLRKNSIQSKKLKIILNCHNQWSGSVERKREVSLDTRHLLSGREGS